MAPGGPYRPWHTILCEDCSHLIRLVYVWGHEIRFFFIILTWTVAWIHQLCQDTDQVIIMCKQVATGGAGGLLRQTLADKVDALHGVISTLAALPKKNDSEQHLFENFHSSRTIRKLILDCPSFAATLWKSALEGKCEIWAQGHRWATDCTSFVSFENACSISLSDLCSNLYPYLVLVTFAVARWSQLSWNHLIPW